MRLSPIWWTDPGKLLLYITLPVVMLAAWLGGGQMHKYGALTFIDPAILALCAGTIGALFVGVRLGGGLDRLRPATAEFEPRRVETAILWLAGVSIACHLVYLGAALAKPAVLLDAISGHRGAVYILKKGLTKIPGVTSFTQLYMLALPLYAAFPPICGRPPSKTVQRTIHLLVAMIALRAFVGLERFALIEAAVAYALPKLTFREQVSRKFALIPLFGFIALLAIFAAGEFMRTWAYYRHSFNSFGEFVYSRFLGYLATATNNAAGLISTTEPMGAPFFTAAWLRKLPVWGEGGPAFLPDSPMAVFFGTYANAEFNNPGGVLTGVLDYGVVGGVAAMFATGLVGGLVFSWFRRGHPAGILLFPTSYTGFLVLTQANYWGDPRAFTVWIVAPLVFFFTVRKARTTWQRQIAR
jgi:hypothetical protein